MAKSETYYWVDEKSTFGGGESPIQCGDPMPDSFLSDERFEQFKKDGLISTEKVPSKRVFSELEQLKAENAELKKGGKSSGITQEQLDTAKGESVQADLDKIDLIKSGLDDIKPAMSKDDVLSKVKELKELINEA